MKFTMTAKQLIAASMDRKSIVGFHLDPQIKPMPAAFLIGMPFKTVAPALRRLRIYKPKTKTKTK